MTFSFHYAYFNALILFYGIFALILLHLLRSMVIRYSELGDCTFIQKICKARNGPGILKSKCAVLYAKRGRRPRPQLIWKTEAGCNVDSSFWEQHRHLFLLTTFQGRFSFFFPHPQSFGPQSTSMASFFCSASTFLMAAAFLLEPLLSSLRKKWELFCFDCRLAKRKLLFVTLEMIEA